MDNICKICGENVLEDSHYYKSHKLKIANYFQEYFPRLDHFTKEPILYKNKDSYFLTDFNDKRNLKKYLESISKEDGLNYLKSWLSQRKESKSLIYSMGEFECRSLCFPSIKYIENYYGVGAYNKICLELGLKIKYNLNYSPETNQVNEIIIDTREAKPYSFDIPVKIQKLNFADYAPIPNPNNIFLERKEIGDWAGVMSNGYERFEREIQRAKDNNAYIIILIEAKYSDLLSINYLPQTRWLKASSDFLLKRARDLYLKFDNFQMVAGGTRKECIELFNKIIKIKDIQTYDIQYLININKI
jgi:hypothetical protein